MPREQVHWEIFESAARQLEAGGEENSAVGEALARARAAGHLGAMAPDAPYYYRLGASSFVEVAERLHGTRGEDTLAFPRELVRGALALPLSEARQARMALAVGWVSHVATDSIFHPAIFHLTGNYYDPDPEEQLRARRRHNAFEVFLDSWWEARISTPRKYTSMRSILRAMGRNLTWGLEALGSAAIPQPRREPVSSAPAEPRGPFHGPGYRPPPDSSRRHPAALPLGEDASSLSQEWGRSLRHLSRLQTVFRSPMLGAAIHHLARIRPGMVGPLASLIAYGRRRADPYFDSPLEYRNPISGESYTRSVEELRGQAVAQTVEWTRLLFSDPDGVTPPGPSMDAGVPGSWNQDMKYFSATPPNFVDATLDY
ncbi:MAG: zinc dependent phospholipase C family protein [Gemmatimonadota bacterium]